MTPNSYLYFDYYQSTDTEHDPLAIGGYLPLERVYSFEPTAGIPEEYKKYVTGVQQICGQNISRHSARSIYGIAAYGCIGQEVRMDKRPRKILRRSCRAWSA